MNHTNEGYTLLENYSSEGRVESSKVESRKVEFV